METLSLKLPTAWLQLPVAYTSQPKALVRIATNICADRMAGGGSKAGQEMQRETIHGTSFHVLTKSSELPVSFNI